MTEVNSRKFYQFLAGFQQDGKSWVDVADSNYGNGDGTVIKSEFRKFMNAEWNGEENGELTNDLINSFWKKIDTNTSASKIAGTKLKNLNALDKTEVANLDKQLEVYVALDEFIANNVKIPNVLTTTGSQWKSDVRDQLSAKLEQYISGGCSGDINAILEEAYPQIANTCTAQYCAVEYQNSLMSTVLKDYPDYKVADDTTLQSLITAYISTVDADTEPDSIKEEIISIMDAYLATAGLGDGSGYDLSNLGLDESNLNNLQIEVLTQSIKNDLANNAKNYEGYEDEFNAAVLEFINAKIKEGGTFEELKSCANEFANSEYKKNLDNIITLDKTYKNVDPNGNFYKELVKQFGEDIAKLISQDSRYLDVYKEILNDVKTKVQDGSLTMDKVSDYIIEQISNRLAEFFPNGYGDMSLNELANLYDKMAKAADEQTDDEKSLAQHREAAINYCDAIAGKSTSLKTAVTDIFGTNWSSSINSLYPSEIESKMAELKAKVAEIGDVSEMTEADTANLLSSIADTYSVNIGASKKINLPNSAQCNGSTITSDRISYEASGAVSYDKSSGKLIIDSSKAGTYTGTVTMYIDNVKVVSKTITVTVENNIDWGSMNTQYSGYISTGTAETPQGTQSLGELYKNNGVINLLDNSGMKKGSIKDSLIPEAKTTFASFVDGTLVSAIKSTGNYDEAALQTAAEKLKTLYNTAFDHLLANRKGNNVRVENTITYGGETYKYQTGKTKSDGYQDTSYSRGCSASNNQLGLSFNENSKKGRWQITVNVKCVMDLFNKFYQQALGA